jgi:hypothetical protein
VVFEEGFEGDELAWGASQEMVATIDDAAAHSGERSLLVAGSHAQGWNYASMSLPMPVLPAARYRLSAWMLVEEMEPGGHSPYLKLAANDADDKWIENYSTQKYDMARAGEWQLLEAYAEVPLNAAIGVIAIEKGAHSIPIRARIRLDDITLELLEAP